MRSTLAPLLLASLLGPSARGVVLPAVRSPEERRQRQAESHQNAARFTYVMGIEVDRGESRGLASGTYLGTTADGRTGFVLTAAHVFHHPADAGIEAAAGLRARVCFGPAPDDKGVRATVREVFFHPGYQILSIYEGKDESTPSSLHYHNDQIILAFDTAPCRESLARIRPAPLFDGEWSFAAMPAKILGFGRFGTVGGDSPQLLFRVHLGDTLVAPGDDRGFPVLQHGTLVDSKAVHKPEGHPVPDAGWDPAHYLQIQDPTWCEYLPDGSLIHLQSHPRQSYLAPGDSGGPLLLEEEGEWKVAATASSTMSFSTRSALPDGSCGAVRDVWHPLRAPERLWIEQVKEGRAPGIELARQGTGDTTAAGGKRKAAGDPGFVPVPGGKRARTAEVPSNLISDLDLGLDGDGGSGPVPSSDRAAFIPLPALPALPAEANPGDLASLDAVNLGPAALDALAPNLGWDASDTATRNLGSPDDGALAFPSDPDLVLGGSFSLDPAGEVPHRGGLTH